MPCLLCKAENAKKQFEKSSLQSNLTMFQVTLNRVDDAITKGLVQDFLCHKHLILPDPEFFGQLKILESMAYTPQPIKAVVHRIAGR